MEDHKGTFRGHENVLYFIWDDDSHVHIVSVIYCCVTKLTPHSVMQSNYLLTLRVSVGQEFGQGTLGAMYSVMSGISARELEAWGLE